MSNQPPNIDFSKIVLPTGTFSTTQPSIKYKNVCRVDTMEKLIEIADIDVVFHILSLNGISPVDVSKANNWLDIDFDDMDEIEFIMEMEKRFDCAIDDDIANDIIQMSPSAFCQLLRSKKRNDKLNDLGI